MYMKIHFCINGKNKRCLMKVGEPAEPPSRAT